MFKTNFSGHSKIWEVLKKLGVLPPNAPVTMGLLGGVCNNVCFIVIDAEIHTI